MKISGRGLMAVRKLTQMIDYSWRGPFTNAELNALHAEGFDHKVLDDDWAAQVSQHSLGWVCARDAEGLVGFVNVPWDGGVHAFILDTLVTERAQHHGVGTRLVAIAADEARAAGCEWLHVDFEDHLRPFYFGSCGFTLTNAGLIALFDQKSLPGRRRYRGSRASSASSATWSDVRDSADPRSVPRMRSIRRSRS
jgi:GNAT superfamily N-acetyltransferase